VKESDAAGRTAGEPMCHPSAEELRMVRALVVLAVFEAARNGEYRASFHGFRVQAVRQCPVPESRVLVGVDLCVRLGTTLVERSQVVMCERSCTALSVRPVAATIDFRAMEQNP
jgi:hypothetical protein